MNKVSWSAPPEKTKELLQDKNEKDDGLNQEKNLQRKLMDNTQRKLEREKKSQKGGNTTKSGKILGTPEGEYKGVRGDHS